MSRFRRRGLGEDFGYVPGEQPADGAQWLKLNTNESPLPPSPRVAPAVAAAAAGLRAYPDPFAEPLRSALARRHRAKPEQVFVANGADQVLDCCYRAFVDPGSTVVRTWPTYSLLPVLTRMFSAVDVEVPFEAGASLPSRFATTPAALRFVVNPNSPTGRWITPSVLSEQLGAASGVVVIDEAYCDFAPESCIPLLPRHENWLVARTLSKSHALAGLRVGYAVGSTALIADLYSVKDSYPVDRCAIAGAIAALDDEQHHRDIVGTVLAERARLADLLTDRGWKVLPSAANFIFAKPPDGASAATVAARLRENRILVRHFETPALAAGLRITVGAPGDTDRLVAALDQQVGAVSGGA